MNDENGILMKFFKWCDSLCCRLRNTTDVARVNEDARKEKTQRLEQNVLEVRKFLRNIEKEEEILDAQYVAVETSVEHLARVNQEITPELSQALYEYTKIHNEKLRIREEKIQIETLYKNLQDEALTLNLESTNEDFKYTRREEVLSSENWSDKEAQLALKKFLRR